MGVWEHIQGQLCTFTGYLSPAGAGPANYGQRSFGDQRTWLIKG